MLKIIEHYQKLLPCDQFVITGSFALRQLGLWFVDPKDLDIILVRPTDESLEILKRISIPKSEDYPDDNSHFRILHESNIHIDFFCKNKSLEDLVELKNGLVLAPVKGTCEAKRKYGRLKDYLQLKIIAEIFYSENAFKLFVDKEKDKILNPKPPAKKSQSITKDKPPLPMVKGKYIEDDEDEDEAKSY